MEPEQTTAATADGEEPLRHLFLFVLAAAASAVVPFAISSITTGAVNGVTWFAFCIAAAAAVMGAIACLVRLGDWVFRRARRPARVRSG